MKSRAPQHPSWNRQVGWSPAGGPRPSPKPLPDLPEAGLHNQEDAPWTEEEREVRLHEQVTGYGREADRNWHLEDD